MPFGAQLTDFACQVDAYSNWIMGAPPISWTHCTCSSKSFCRRLFSALRILRVSNFLTSRSIASSRGFWTLRDPPEWLGPRSLSFGCVGEWLRVCHPWVEGFKGLSFGMHGTKDVLRSNLRGSCLWVLFTTQFDRSLSIHLHKHAHDAFEITH